MNFKSKKIQLALFCVGTFATLIVVQSLSASYGGSRFSSLTPLLNTFQENPTLESYEIDNSHTSVVFAVSHFGLSYTYGRFNKCSGEFVLEGGKPGTKGFQFSIDANSIDTNNEERDKHLCGPDFFNTEQFPEISFVTTGIEKIDGAFHIKGDMAMLGQTQPVTMPMNLVGIGKGPFGKQRAGFFTKFSLKRSDFGMDKMKDQIGDNISITFSFEGVRTK